MDAMVSYVGHPSSLLRTQAACGYKFTVLLCSSSHSDRRGFLRDCGKTGITKSMGLVERAGAQDQDVV
jgi:hypothetical protein